MDFWVVLALFGFFGAGIVATLVFFRLADRLAERKVDQRNSLKGVQARQDQAERLMSFMTEVKAAFDEAKAAGKDPKEFATKDLPAIALRYPDVVIKFGSRLYKMMKSGSGIDLDGLMAA